MFLTSGEGEMARKCRYCKAEIPKIKDCATPYQRAGYCDGEHMARYGLEKARAQQERQRRKSQREAKDRIKTKSEHAKEAQAAFNAWVRARDEVDACISCGRHHKGQYHAGHYRTVGACPELRFEPLNAHKQCAPCNNHLSGNLVEYRIRLARKIGQDSLDWLEGPHEPKRYTIEDLKAIKAEYRRKLRELKK